MNLPLPHDLIPRHTHRSSQKEFIAEGNKTRPSSFYYKTANLPPYWGNFTAL